jgi:DNA-directed RNA polymerase sigma subunit (sigma70/sigma32)
MELSKLLNDRNLLMREVYGIDRYIWEVLKKYRTKINKRTYFILKARLHERKNLEEVGKEYDVTRERVRQIEMNGIIEIDNLIRRQL